jgi:flagellar biosynthesis protein FlhG
MPVDRPKRLTRRRKSARGLSEISHVFLSAAEKPEAEEQADKGWALWMPEVDILSITSGEGVRGKTFLAANLAFGLSYEGYRLAIVDADARKPGILEITGAVRADEDDGASTSNSVFGSIPEIDFQTAGRLIPGPEPSPGSPVSALEKVARRVQRLVVDTAPVGLSSLAIWKATGLAIVITEPSSDGMRSSYLTIKRINRVAPAARLGVIVNMAGSLAEAERCFRKISSVCRRFLKTNVRNYGYIIHSAEVAEACARAIPLIRAFPESRIAKCVDSIVRLVIMDELAIARRRREVTLNACVSREGR